MSTPTARTLGGVCYAIDVGDEALPCNPAFTARETNDDFRGQLFISNNISYLGDVMTLLSGDGDEQTVRRLFSQTHASQFEANIEGAYRQPTFGVALSPFRVMYYSLVRDRAWPVITLLAAEEQTLRFHFAGYAGNDWSWGVQLRGVQRKLISQTFTLTDAAVENSNIFDPQRQNALYVEPGLVREWWDVPWQPQFAVTVVNGGFVDHKFDDFPMSPELHVSGAVRPPIALGRWEIGVDAAANSKTQEWSDPFRFGSSYELGLTRFSGSVGRSDHTLGFLLRYKHMTAGLTYESRYLENWLGEDEWIRSVALQIGVAI